MSGRLSFAIAVNLMTEQFKKGANQIRASFRAIKAETVAFAAALGAGGIGLTELVGRFAQVARETSRVTTALKNVSGGTAQYADNLSYVTRLAKQYGLEVNALTSSYARFTATANVSGMSLLDQRKIFESLSRASTAFGLSAEQTNYVFTALSQMMSKGKISSEELRQQMGEQLPVALQAMAKAAGVSMGELDKLLQQGRLMSADILPKFADALNELIPTVSTDNLESSINRLQNTFTDLVNSSGVQGFYKRAVELVDSLLQHVRDGVAGIVAFVATMIGLKMVANIAGYFQKINRAIARTVTVHQRAEEQKLLATQNRIKAEQRLQVAEAAYANASADQQLAAYDRMEKAKTALARAQVNERRAEKAAEQAAEAASAVQASTTWGRAYNRITMAAARAWKTIKGLMASFGWTALIAGISAAVAALANMAAEWRRIRNAYDDYRSRLEQAAADNTEAVKLQNLLSIMNDRKRSQEEINAAQETLQGMLGEEKLTQDEINKRVQARIALLKEAARAEQAATEIAQAERSNREILQKSGFTEQQMQSLMQLRSAIQPGDINTNDEYFGVLKEFRKSNGGKYNIIEEYKLDNAVAEYAQNMRILNDATQVLSESQLAAAKVQSQATVSTGTGAGTGGTAAQSELEKQQQRYAQSLRELEARREVEKLSTDEYSKALDELNRQSLIAARATGDREVLESQYLQTLQQAVNNPAYSRAQAELTAVQAEYAEAQRTAKARLDARLITEEQYRNALLQAASSAALAAVSIDGIGDAADSFVEKMRGVVAANTAPIEVPTLGTRDTTFDYKKSATDIGREKLEIWIEYRDSLKALEEELKQKGITISEELSKNLDNAIANVTSLEDALKLAEVQEDIENFRKQLAEGIYGGIKDIASNADRLVSAFQNAADVLSDADASGWEKVLAVWNAMIQTVDGIMSTINAVENISAIVAKLSGAEETNKRLADSSVETVGATVAGKAVEVAANVAASQILIKQDQKEAAAAVTKMAAKSTAAYAGIPFVGAALAAGQIAAMMALIEGASQSIPKFATGGIVTGGPATGDRILARVNSGEMILNPAQQSNLFKMLNEGNTATAGHTTGISIGFDRVRGSDIYLALKNYMKSTGKRL